MSQHYVEKRSGTMNMDLTKIWLQTRNVHFQGEYVLPLNAGHRRKDHGTRQQQETLSACDLCEMNFTSSRALRHHKLIHHKLSPYRCDQCAKYFNGRSVMCMCLIYKHKHSS